MGDNSKFHLIKCDKICSPLSLGGLSIRNLKVFNRALLGKRLWQYNLEPGAFSKLVIEYKYGGKWGGLVH